MALIRLPSYFHDDTGNSLESIHPIWIILFFGMLSVLLGHMRFDISNSLGVKSNLAEIALLLSVPFLRNIYMVISVSLFTALNVTPAGSVVAETLNHTAALIFAWYAYRYTTSIHNMYWFIILWSAIVAIYYCAFLVPIYIFLMQLLFQTQSSYILLNEYIFIIKTIPFELSATLLSSCFFLCFLRELTAKQDNKHELELANNKLEEYIQKLEKVAYYDGLSHLPNGLQLEHDLRTLEKNNFKKPCAYALAGFRLKGLHTLNEKYDLEFSNQLMSDIATNFNQRLIEWFKENPDFCPPESVQSAYRLETDCIAFILHVPNNPLELQKIFASSFFTEYIRQTIAKRGLQFHIYFHAGITFAPYDTTEFRQLINNLNSIIYNDSKVSIWNYLSFNAEMYTRNLHTENLRSILPQLIESDCFYFEYQPKISSATTKIDSFEVLARLQHKNLGVVPPSEFIPLTEELGLALPFFTKTLASVHQVIHLLKMEQPHLYYRFAINLSPNLLGLCQLEMICNEIARLDLGHYLELEITEGSMILIDDAVNLKIKQLQHLGVTFAIDDFGTGYANLASMLNFEPDILKIDKSFIDKIPYDDKCRKLIMAMISMASSLNMQVVGEGIENQIQHDFLVTHGCHFIQGFLHSKPVSQKKMLSMIRNNTLTPDATHPYMPSQIPPVLSA